MFYTLHLLQAMYYKLGISLLHFTDNLYRFTGHGAGVTDVCFSPAGNLMASSCMDGHLAVWIPSITGESTFWKGHVILGYLIYTFTVLIVIIFYL
jgi:WD40 repeat protein